MGKKSKNLEGGSRSKAKIKRDKKIVDETLVTINGKLEKEEKMHPLFSISFTRDEIEADYHFLN